MLKQVVLTAASALFALSAQAAYKDGVYEDSGMGHDAQIVVRVTVAGGKISEVKVLRHGDTPELCGSAIEEIGPAVVKKQSLDGVEAVSGASDSSKGIMEAVGKILKKASM